MMVQRYCDGKLSQAEQQSVVQKITALRTQDNHYTCTYDVDMTEAAWLPRVEWGPISGVFSVSEETPQLNAVGTHQGGASGHLPMTSSPLTCLRHKPKLASLTKSRVIKYQPVHRLKY